MSPLVVVFEDQQTIDHIVRCAEFENLSVDTFLYRLVSANKESGEILMSMFHASRRKQIRVLADALPSRKAKKEPEADAVIPRRRAKEVQTPAKSSQSSQK